MSLKPTRREIQKRRAQLRKDSRPEEEMEALFREELAHEKKMFAAEKHFGQVGAFEGANYEARGYYRPEIDCIMFSRTDTFCEFGRSDRPRDQVVRSSRSNRLSKTGCFFLVCN